MTHKPRILLITPGFPADENDSACVPALQVYARDLAKKLPQFHFEVLALHYPFRNGTYSWFGLEIHSLNLPSGNRMHRWWGLWQAWQWLVRFQRHHELAGIHAFWLSDGAWLGWRLARRFNLHYLSTIMGQDALTANHYHRWMRLPVANVVAVSRRAAEAYAQLGRGVPKVVPWGWGPETSQEKVGRDIDVLGVGALIPLKDYATFLQVLAEARAERSSLRAVLVGDGPEACRLKRMARELGLEKQCEFKGKLPRNEVLALMARSKVLLHPSTFEAFGFVFLEALGAGMQIVSRPVGMAETSSKWHLGEDAEALAKGLLSALEKPSDGRSEWPHPLESCHAAYGAIYRTWLDGEN